MAGNVRVGVRSGFGQTLPQKPLERWGSSCSASCTKNQPRRPNPRPLRGTKQIRPDCLQIQGTKQMRSIQPTHPNWLSEINMAGNVRVGVRPSFGQTLPPKPLERWASSCSASCTKTQPHRPILKPLRGTMQILPDCFQVPNQRH